MQKVSLPKIYLFAHQGLCFKHSRKLDDSHKQLFYEKLQKFAVGLIANIPKLNQHASQDRHYHQQ